MSFTSYNIPISDDGTLPVKLFGEKLNFKRLKEKNIKWLICYGTSDDLVEKDTSLAPLDYVDAEVSGISQRPCCHCNFLVKPEISMRPSHRIRKGKIPGACEVSARS